MNRNSAPHATTLEARRSVKPETVALIWCVSRKDLIAIRAQGARRSSLRFFR